MGRPGLAELDTGAALITTELFRLVQRSAAQVRVAPGPCGARHLGAFVAMRLAESAGQLGFSELTAYVNVFIARPFEGMQR